MVDEWDYMDGEENGVVIINIAQSVPLEYALPLYGFLMPLLVAVTTVTNTFIVVVLSQKHLRTPTNFVLVSMAISDLLTGLTSLPWFLYYYTLKGYEADEKWGLNSFWCHVYPFLSYIVPTIWHTAGFVHRLCTPKTTRAAVAIITAFSLLTEMPDLFGKYMEQVEVDDRSICILRHSSWVLEVLGVQLFYTFHYWFRVVLVQVLPCILLIIFTYKLARTIHQTEVRKRSWVSALSELPSSSNHHNSSLAYGEESNGNSAPVVILNDLPSSSSVAASSRQRHSSQLTEINPVLLGATGGASIASSNCDRKGSMVAAASSSCTGSSGRFGSLYATNRMLAAICAVFLLLEVPAAFIFTLHFLIAARYVPAAGAYRILNVALIIRNILIVLTSPIQFFIYCSMSEQFRLTVRQLFSSRLLFVAQAQYSLILVDVDFINQQQLQHQRKKQFSFVKRNNSSPTTATILNSSRIRHTADCYQDKPSVVEQAITILQPTPQPHNNQLQSSPPSKKVDFQ